MRPASLILISLCCLGLACGPRETTRAALVSDEAQTTDSEPGAATAEGGSPPPTVAEGARDGPCSGPVPLKETPATEPPAVDHDGPFQVVDGIEPPRRLGGPFRTARLGQMFSSSRYTLGVCIITFTISATGEIDDMRFLKPEEPGPELRSAFQEMVKDVRFEPARQDGRPIAVYYNISVNHCPVEPLTTP